MRIVRTAIVLVGLLLPIAASAQPVKNRISVLVDSSGSMLLTPDIITMPETCVAHRLCRIK